MIKIGEQAIKDVDSRLKELEKKEQTTNIFIFNRKWRNILKERDLLSKRKNAAQLYIIIGEKAASLGAEAYTKSSLAEERSLEYLAYCKAELWKKSTRRVWA